MLRVADIDHLLRKDVVVTCTDGEVVRGRMIGYLSDADAEDGEKECISLDQGDPDVYLDIEMDEIAGVAEA